MIYRYVRNIRVKHVHCSLIRKVNLSVFHLLSYASFFSLSFTKLVWFILKLLLLLLILLSLLLILLYFICFLTCNILPTRVIFFFNNQREIVCTLFFSHAFYKQNFESTQTRPEYRMDVILIRNSQACVGEGRKVGEFMINRLWISNYLCFEISKAN